MFPFKFIIILEWSARKFVVICIKYLILNNTTYFEVKIAPILILKGLYGIGYILNWSLFDSKYDCTKEWIYLFSLEVMTES